MSMWTCAWAPGSRALGGAIWSGVFAVVMLATADARAADYYVRPSGNDGNAGTSQTQAWKTIGRVNGQVLHPGDRVLFEGGETFAGNLIIGSTDFGSATDPIVVTSFGTGRATIVAPDTYAAIYVFNTPGVSISNLTLVGPGETVSTREGVYFLNMLSGGVKLGHAWVDSVEVSGFYRGVAVAGWNGAAGWDDVRITNVVAHDNAEYGIYVFAQTPNAHRNVYVGHCTAYNILGKPGQTSSHSGSGITVSGTDGGTIERCVAYNNGELCQSTGGGPVGIWAYASNAITIQYNESYDNSTGNAWDGGGFDLDVDTTNSLMQYNYSHGNAGAGYLIYDGGGAYSTGNVVRYNVSENDGRKNGFGAIYVGGYVDTTEVYGNTVFISRPAEGNPPAVYIGSAARNTHVRNNVLVTSGGVPLVTVYGTGTGTLFQGNAYWSSGGSFVISWNGTTYSTLAAWRTATGQERLNGVNVGRNVDPQLTDAGNGGSVGDADALATLTAYTLQPDSPLVDGGLDLTGAPFYLSVGATDYYGNDLPQGGAFDVGAHEWTQAPPACEETIEIGASSYFVAEGGTVTVTVTRSGDCGGSVTADYATSNGTAAEGSDYVASTGTLTFAPGQTVATIDIATIDDPYYEGAETFDVSLTSVGGAAMGAVSSASATIADDDASGVLEFAADFSSVSESAASATITVTRSRNTAGPASVTWSAESNTATLGADATAPGGTLTFLNGETSKTFTVTVLGDTRNEGDESLYLSLSSPSAGLVLGARQRAVLTIADDDSNSAGFRFNAQSYTQPEPASTATVTVTISRGTKYRLRTQTVYFTARSGSAAAGEDFAGVTSQAVSFASGELSKTVTVTVFGDATPEGNESVNLELTNGGTEVPLAGMRRAILVITDEDYVPKRKRRPSARSRGREPEEARIVLARGLADDGDGFLHSKSLPGRQNMMDAWRANSPRIPGGARRP